MTILSWAGTDGGPSSYSLREVVEDMHKTAALTEILGTLLRLDGHGDEYEKDVALELVFEAGSLGQALGRRALELLDAQAAPPAPTPIRQPRKRTARRRAA